MAAKDATLAAPLRKLLDEGAATGQFTISDSRDAANANSRGRNDRYAHPLGRWPRHARSRVSARVTGGRRSRWAGAQVRNVPQTLLWTRISVWVRSPFTSGRQGYVQDRLGGSPGIREHLRVVGGGCQRVGALEDHRELPAEALRVGCSGVRGSGHEAIAEGKLVPLRETGDLRELSGALDDGVVEGAARKGAGGLLSGGAKIASSR
jgi:hypothetical protein